MPERNERVRVGWHCAKVKDRAEGGRKGLLQAACNDDGASNTRTSRSKWHLPALIVNDVVATESHFCELILGRYGLWCSSYCRPGSLTCPGARARSRPVTLTR